MLPPAREISCQYEVPVSSLFSHDAGSMAINKELRVFAESRWRDREFVRPLVGILAGLAAVLAAEIACLLLMTHGHLIYGTDAAYTHLALAKQITQGTYGVYPGEASAPSSTILYPVLLAGLRPLGLGAWLPLVINTASTLVTGLFALLLARECRIPLDRVPPSRLVLLTVVIAMALDLPGLVILGLEHSLHVAMTVAYLLGLVRFVRRGRCDWWWFVCILVQPVIRFEAAGMLVADVLIFLAFRKYGYALATLAIGIILVGGYSLFLYSLGLPLLPTSVLARSEWSNDVVASHSGLFSVFAALVRNLYFNLRSFGAAQMLGGVALAMPWLGWIWTDLGKRPLSKSDRISLATLAFMAFVTIAQLTGGKINWVPPRYEAYVIALNLCGLAVIFREKVRAWCEFPTWPRVLTFCLALLMVFTGYAAQFVFIPTAAQKEYEGQYELQRFVTQFYHAPVASDMLGYMNFDNPYYVLDLSGLSSEIVRQARARQARADKKRPDWMDDLLASHGIGLAIIDPENVKPVPNAWTLIAELRPAALLADDAQTHFAFYARRPSDVAHAVEAMDRFAATLPASTHLKRLYLGLEGRGGSG
jgi:hypothetical protein